MRIALLGSNGQLGKDLTGSLGQHQVTALTRDEFDVTDEPRARATLLDLKPEIIINTTAYHRVDDCETQPEIAYQTNVLAVLNLARTASECGAQLVHFSTDYVFDGDSTTPYTEASPPMPLSIYGNSKLAGEYIVRSVAKNHLLIRTCGLYGKAGSRGKGGNFVETMLAKGRTGQSLRVVADQVLTPTSTKALAYQVAVMLAQKASGLFHVTDEGGCSWYEFAAAIFELAGIPADLSPTTSDLYKSPALRPRYSVLENARLKQLGFNHMPHWREDLAAYLR